MQRLRRELLAQKLHLGKDRLVGGHDVAVEAVVAIHDAHLDERIGTHLVGRDEALAEPDCMGPTGTVRPIT